jgi:GcrA cell cycle regulator
MTEVLIPWTDERIARIRSLHLQHGLGAGRIADIIGGTTRNAVLGKLNRMGILRRHDAEVPSRGKGDGRGSVTAAETIVRRVRQVVEAKLERPPAAILEPSEARSPKTVMQLGFNDCRFPLDISLTESTMDTLFCGARTALREDGAQQPYCAEHCRRAFVPAKERRKASTPYWLR